MITDLQKASLWKRISAALFDFILIVMVIVGAVTACSALFGYEKHLDTFAAKCEYYSEKYDVELPVTRETYEGMSEEEQTNYMTAQKELNADKEAVRAYKMYNTLP